MTALTLRVWATTAAGWGRDGWVLTGLAAIFVAALAGLVLMLAWVAVIPVVHLAVLALLPLALCGSAVTGMLLPARRRPVVGRAAAPVETPHPAAPVAPAARPTPDGVGVPRRAGVGRAAHSRRTRPVSEGFRGGCAPSWPAAAAAPSCPRAAAGHPVYRTDRATVPTGATP